MCDVWGCKLQLKVNSLYKCVPSAYSVAFFHVWLVLPMWMTRPMCKQVVSLAPGTSLPNSGEQQVLWQHSGKNILSVLSVERFAVKRANDGRNVHILRHEVILAYIWFNLDFKITKIACLWPLRKTKHYAYVDVMGEGEHIQRIAQGHILIIVLTAVCLLVSNMCFKSSMTE